MAATEACFDQGITQKSRRRAKDLVCGPNQLEDMNSMKRTGLGSGVRFIAAVKRPRASARTRNLRIRNPLIVAV